MLFNSYAFIFLFLPIVIAAFFVIGRWGTAAAAAFLAFASLLFYAWSGWRFVPVLLTSIGLNYGAGHLILRWRIAGRARAARVALGAGVALNLAALTYFKYMNFLVAAVSDAFGAGLDWTAVLLPVGISFFTFTQIAFLVDTFRGGVGPVRPTHYLLFVTYFPHLIAGPVLHHAEMMPQFRRPGTYRPDAEALSVGLTVFILGLVKKVAIADNLAGQADVVFSPAAVALLDTPEAWRGVLAYTLQIYFDFSAYCDMAIGVSRMLNITLPANFSSPYKACSVTEFWRRWHMTLSRFLRDYLYIPLGGNRRGPVRRCGNLLATMALGGLWHGAGWTFLVWGGLHGLYLCVNHAWAGLSSRRPWLRLPRPVAWALTFVAVMLAWVFFRAPDLGTAGRLLLAMAGLGGGDGSLLGAAAQGPGTAVQWLVGDPRQFLVLAAALFIALALPNMQQVMERHQLVLGQGVRLPASASHLMRITWAPNPAWTAAVTGLFLLALARMDRVSQFLYFQF